MELFQQNNGQYNSLLYFSAGKQTSGNQFHTGPVQY